MVLKVIFLYVALCFGQVILAQQRQEYAGVGSRKGFPPPVSFVKSYRGYSPFDAIYYNGHPTDDDSGERTSHKNTHHSDKTHETASSYSIGSQTSCPPCPTTKCPTCPTPTCPTCPTPTCPQCPSVTCPPCPSTTKITSSCHSSCPGTVSHVPTCHSCSMCG